VDALKRFIPTVFLSAAIAYFGYHALTGEQGLLNWVVVRAEIAEVESELVLARAEREDLQASVERLSDDTLDLDYVEERARAVLNVAHPRDFIIKTAPEENR
jgi:cell division protein FtsB